MDSEDPFDITPVGENGINAIDPYELFSTPPGDLVLSSTPSKPGRGAGIKHAKALESVADTSSDSIKSMNSITKHSIKDTTTRNNNKTRRALKHRNINKSKSADQATSKPSKRNTTKRQKSENLWDKCLKKNPELAQFVDEFNKSLDEACKKPLDTDE